MNCQIFFFDLLCSYFMKILFYSTNSNKFDCKTFKINSFPTCKMEFDELVNCFPEHEFFVVTQTPGMFLIDLFDDGSFSKSVKVKYFVINSDESFSAEKFSETILKINPDVAIAVSFWTTPFDWLFIKDSLVADILNSNGIKTYCTTNETSFISFDKNLTNQKVNELISNKKIKNLKIPKSIYVHHELFCSEKNKINVQENVYKEYIFSEIKKLNFPVIIKDNYCTSSYGMEVATSYNQVISFLNSKRNNSDRIIQEYIEGINFGTEIYSSKNKNKLIHHVLSPFIFSTNKYGITSPKQSVKIGPIKNPKFKISKLKKSLKQLACELKFCGITQVDLILKNDEWYLLEINSRVSGMSKTYASSMNKSLLQILTELTQEKKLKSIFERKNQKENLVINFKVPIQTENQMEEISKIKNVKYVNQLHNLEAKQDREKGFCEIVLGNTKNFEQLKLIFDDFVNENKLYVDETLLQGAYDLFNLLKKF